MPLIIGVGHQKNVGKDTFVGYCVDVLRAERRRLNIKRRGFADKLYDFLHSVYGWAGFKPKVYYDEHPEAKNDIIIHGKTVRTLLIEVGTPVMRAYDDDIWINACLKTIDYDVLFCTDLRFPNEFTAIEESGGNCLRIHRPSLPIPTDIADTALNDFHERWHLTIVNDEDRNKLYKEADAYVRKYILPRLT